MSAQVKIYTTRYCGYCFAAKRLLNRKQVDYEEIDVTGQRDTRRWLAQETGRTTVPQIFINGRSMGGFDDINALNKRGELDPLLAASPGDAV